jgi:hypothetical protein
LAQVHIVAKDERGVNPRAEVERVYLSREEVSGDRLKPGAEIDLVPSSVSSGPELEVGDRALVSFSNGPRGRFYQSSGQLLFEDIDNELYGIFPLQELWKHEGDKSLPPSIRVNARPDPKRIHMGRSYMSAIRLDVIEADIQASIEAVRRGHTEPKWTGTRWTDRNRDGERMPDGCVLYYDRDSPTVASDVMAFIYHRARPDEIVAQRHAAMTERLRAFAGPFGLESVCRPSALVFADGGYWHGVRQDDASAVAMSGWYTFRGDRVLEDKAVEDDHFHYQFNACDARLDYQKLIHDDFKQAIAALDGYRAIWHYSRHGLAYRRGYYEEEDAPRDDYDWPIDSTEQYKAVCADKSLDVDGRNSLYTLYPAQYWDAELCQRALGYGPDEVIKRLQDKAPRAEKLGNGVYTVLNDDPKISYEDFLAMNNKYKALLGLP